MSDGLTDRRGQSDSQTEDQLLNKIEHDMDKARSVRLVDPPMLSPAERELLHMLAEEAGEVVQACMKVLRHGWQSVNPFNPLTPNSDLLDLELRDVQAVVELMRRQGHVPAHFGKPDGVSFVKLLERKLAYTHYQREPEGDATTQLPTDYLNDLPQYRCECGCEEAEAGPALAGIQPLRWLNSSPDMACDYANSILGPYYVSMFTTIMPRRTMFHWKLGRDSSWEADKVNTVDEAKAAAQADYERRILSVFHT
jgi:hypothetical protein